MLKTSKADVHGRYVTHLFISEQELSIDACFADGLHVNDLLVRKGQAHIIG